jgi:hypothetical protein
MGKVREYDIGKNMKYELAVCEDCRHIVEVKRRPFEAKDDYILHRLWYQGDNKKARMVYYGSPLQRD